MAYYNAGRYADARSTLQRAVDGGSTDANATLYLGLSAEELADYTAARSAYEQYVSSAGADAGLKEEIRGRMALMSRKELKQLARGAIEREQQLATQPPTPNSIAVLPFRLVGISDEFAPLRTALAEMIVTDIGFTRLTSIERIRVQSLLDEMVLTAGGITSEETGARMGHLLRAERVVQGQLSGTGADGLLVDAVVLNLAQRTGGDALTREGQAQAIFDLEKQIVFGILTAARYDVTPAERERINENRAANLLAFLAYGRGLEAMDRGDYDQASAEFRRAAQLDPSFDAASTQAAEAAQIGAAAQVSTSEIALQGAPTVVFGTTTLAQEIAASLNPSPAPTLTQMTLENNPSSSVAPLAGERTNPSSETTQSPPISPSRRATVVVTIPNPGAGAPPGRTTGGGN
jgi:tetratricopeptide (TPR) repeat protein